MTTDLGPSIRLTRGFLLGAVATVVMSAFMLVATATGIAPMPQPIPIAVLSGLLSGLGIAWPLGAVMAVGLVLHLGYGGVWAAMLTRAVPRVRPAHGLALGIALWIVMGLAFLPAVGWGPFGVSEQPAIAAATLVLHLIYGASVGWGPRLLPALASTPPRAPA